MSEPIVLPRPLEPGDEVAIVAPSGPVVADERLEAGVAVLESWGLEPVVMPGVRGRRGHLAGPDEERAADLDAAFGDPRIRAVFAARGGYGVTRILDRLAWDSLAADPIIISGFSDVSALLLAAWRRLGLVTLHAPSLSNLATVEAEATSHLRALLFGASRPPTIAGGRTIAGGVAEGRLLGGNLSLVTSLVGTADAPLTSESILFLEDVGEYPYRIDRMLTQLLRAGLLDDVAGIALGQFVRCDPPEDRPSLTVDEVLVDALSGLDVPVVSGLPVGHVRDHHAVAIGGLVRLDADAGTLVLMDRPGGDR